MNSRAQLQLMVDHLKASGQLLLSSYCPSLMTNLQTHPANDVFNKLDQILNAFLSHPQTTLSQAHDVPKKRYVHAMEIDNVWIHWQSI